jgi:hypothetical protein
MRVEPLSTNSGTISNLIHPRPCHFTPLNQPLGYNPLPSHTSAFKRVCDRLVNRNEQKQVVVLRILSVVAHQLAVLVQQELDFRRASVRGHPAVSSISGKGFNKGCLPAYNAEFPEFCSTGVESDIRTGFRDRGDYFPDSSFMIQHV